MEDRCHNGWTNYETWSIALFIDNESYLQDEVTTIIEENQEDYEAEQQIKELIYNFLEVENLNPYQMHMINASLEEVNYREIVKTKRDDLKNED